MNLAYTTIFMPIFLWPKPSKQEYRQNKQVFRQTPQTPPPLLSEQPPNATSSNLPYLPYTTLQCSISFKTSSTPSTAKFALKIPLNVQMRPSSNPSLPSSCSVNTRWLALKLKAHPATPTTASKPAASFPNRLFTLALSGATSSPALLLLHTLALHAVLLRSAAGRKVRERR